MHTIKSKLILPVIVFLAGLSFLAGLLYNIEKNQQKQNRTTANLNAITYAEHMKTDILEGINVTDTLEQILISENGQVNNFSQIASNMMTDSIQSIQIAPNGVVTDIYPSKGNEAGKINLLHDKDRGKISRYAKDNHTLIMQGPFHLKQGGYGIAVRNPVYLENSEGKNSFWGFTIVIIRVPEIFSDSVKALSGFGYHYRLSKTISPWNTKYEEVYSSGGKIVNPVSYKFDMGGSQWKLVVMPKHGWVNMTYLYIILIGGILIILLLTGLTRALLVLNENRNKFRKLAITDGLTGIYNRQGFDELVTQYLNQYPDKHCIAAQFDIDDFKFINDIYGHATGDVALQTLAQSMQTFFPESAIFGRNGGDEFCIFLPEHTYKDTSQMINQFTKMKRTFPFEGGNYPFSISLGYAEYPLYADNLSQLMRCADAALYEVKLRGKHDCLAYHKNLRLGIRTQLGFALKDVSENLPGAFIIYKADRTTYEILFANREFLNLTGCQSMDELLTYTHGSFRNLIQEDERNIIKERIWYQIEDGHSNDYVHFHLLKKDGSSLPVLDHGRIVENDRYGKFFYVLLMDANALKNNAEYTRSL